MQKIVEKPTQKLFKRNHNLDQKASPAYTENKF